MCTFPIVPANGRQIGFFGFSACQERGNMRAFRSKVEQEDKIQIDYFSHWKKLLPHCFGSGKFIAPENKEERLSRESRNAIFFLVPLFSPQTMQSKRTLTPCPYSRFTVWSLDMFFPHFGTNMFVPFCFPSLASVEKLLELRKFRKQGTSYRNKTTCKPVG